MTENIGNICAPELERAKKIIYNYDFSLIIKRLVNVNRWSKKHALEADKLYRNYIFLKLKYGNQYILPPSQEIDEFWHEHILHTKEYLEFCKKVFGKFLHHDPTLFNNQFQQIFEEQTQRLYFKEFAEYIYSFRPLGIRMRAVIFLKSIVVVLNKVRVINLKNYLDLSL